MSRTPSHGPGRTARCAGLLLAAALSAVPAEAQAQEGTARAMERDGAADVRPERSRVGVVRGSVVEAGSSRPVSGATIRLLALGTRAAGSDSAGSSEPGGERTTVSDEAGAYRFDDVAEGRYRIEVSGLGYRSAEVWIDLPGAWEVRRSVGLVVEPVPLEAVGVDLTLRRSRVRPDLPARPDARVPRPSDVTAAGSAGTFTMDTRVLDPADLPGVGALGEPDVFRALQRLPGVSGRGDFSAGLWTRGAPWGMTQILLDGLPLYDPLHLGGIAAGMAADGLESVAIMPGVRPSSASEGASGTVILQTRPAAGRASASVALSSMALRARVEDRWLNDRVGLALTARRSWWDLLSPPGILTGDPSGSSIDYRFADVSGRFDADLGAVGRLELGGLWEEDLLYGNIRRLVSSSRGRWGNRLGWMRLGRRLGAYRIEGMVGGVDYAVRTRPLPWASFRGPEGIPSLDLLETRLTYRAWKVRVEGRHGGERITWAAGVQGVDERLEQSGLDVSDRQLPGVGEPARLDRERVWAETSVQQGSLGVAAGVSFDLLPAGAAAPAPTTSLRVRWSAAPWLRLEAARGEAVQFSYPIAPTGVALGTALATAYQWVLAGDGVPALASRTSSLGAEIALPHDLTARLSAWWREIDGVWMGGVSGIPADDPQFVVPTPESFGEEHGRGLELDLGWRGEWMTADAGYAFARSRFSAAGLPSWPSPSERRHALDLHTSAGVGAALRVGADLTVESGWPVVRGPSTPCAEGDAACLDYPEGLTAPEHHSFDRAPAYASLDLKVSWERSWERVSLGATGSLRNVLGRDNLASFRTGTCQGSELVSPVCETSRGIPRFSPGLTRPTPSLALSLRF